MIVYLLFWLFLIVLILVAVMGSTYLHCRGRYSPRGPHDDLLFEP